MLEVLEKPEEDWWVARNAMGNVGFVPVNYLRRTNDEDLLDSPDLNECSLESNEINTSSS
jgi:hypothetical protein